MARRRRGRARRQRRLVAIGLLGLVVAAGGLIAVIVAGGAGPHVSSGAAHASRATSTANRPPRAPSSFAVGLRVLQLVDPSRTIRLPDGSVQPRTIRTYVRYPALGPAGRTDLRNAPAARIYGPFPLVVFGHGFAVTPALYAHLLQAWTRAGYVVAAPVFPLGNADAPGGPNEADLVNQPADMSFVISRLLAAGSDDSSPLAGLVDPKAIAVSGQSDGGDTALAAAYDHRYRDRRITAAAILSGAEIPGVGGYTFPPGSPPLLATQGTADTINTPAETELFFAGAHRPKYLLRLLGAEHLPPYRDEPQLGIVERVTIAFFDAFLKHRPGALAHLTSVGHVSGIASLLADP
jgi:fermentation-respiration switch protein FrsA (DUF1100 family)